jgi:hypothetical protein
MSNGTTNGHGALRQLVLAIVAMLSCQGSAQGSFNIPAKFNSVLERLGADAIGCLGPVGDAHGLPIVSDQSRAACVSALLLIHRPDAVAGFVIPIHILPFDAVNVAGPWPHIAIERLESCKPLLAHYYSSSTVVGISRAVCVGASHNHAVPNTVFLTPGHPVRSVSCDARFFLEAAARQALSLVQATGNDFTNRAAFAATSPVSAFTGTNINEIKNGPATDHLSVQVFDVLRKANSIAGSHEMFLSREGRLWLEPAGVQPPVRLALFYHLPAILLGQSGGFLSFEFWEWFLKTGAIYGLGFIVIAGGVALGLYFIYAIGRQAVALLSDLRTKWIPRVVDEHMGFVETVKTAAESTSSAVNKLTESHTVSFDNHTKTHRALECIVKAQQEGDVCEEARRHLDDAIRELK